MVAGCGNQEVFNCQDDAGCGVNGQCESSGFCSFPDPACPSGRRYGDLAGVGLTGECVAPVDASTGALDPSTSGTTSSSDAASTTLEGTTTPSTSSGVDDGSSSTAAETASDASSSTTTGQPCLAQTFLDGFNRPDSADLENGWTELRPATFRLNNETVEIDDLHPSGLRNLAMRPGSDASVNAAVSIAWDHGFVSTGPGEDYPQLYLRATAGDLEVTGYACVVTQTGDVEIRRYVDDQSSGLGGASAEDLPSRTSSWRLLFSAQGTAPVELECTLEGDGEVFATAVVSDVDAQAIRSAGTAGFSAASSGAFGGKSKSELLRFDDFQYDYEICGD